MKKKISQENSQRFVDRKYSLTEKILFWLIIFILFWFSFNLFYHYPVPKALWIKDEILLTKHQLNNNGFIYLRGQYLKNKEKFDLLKQESELYRIYGELLLKDLVSSEHICQKTLNLKREINQLLLKYHSVLKVYFASLEFPNYRVPYYPEKEFFWEEQGSIVLPELHALAQIQILEQGCRKPSVAPYGLLKKLTQADWDLIQSSHLSFQSSKIWFLVQDRTLFEILQNHFRKSGGRDLTILRSEKQLDSFWDTLDWSVLNLRKSIILAYYRFLAQFDAVSSHFLFDRGSTLALGNRYYSKLMKYSMEPSAENREDLMLQDSKKIDPVFYLFNPIGKTLLEVEPVLNREEEIQEFHEAKSLLKMSITGSSE